MRNRVVILFASLVGALCSAQAPSAQLTSSAAWAQRAERLQKLAKERTPEESGGAAVNAEIRRIVQEQVLETLNKSEEPEDVREALKFVLGYPKFPSDPKYPFAYSSSLQGVKTLVVGYSLPGTEIKVAIDGFRKVGLTYELIVGTGSALDGCNFSLYQLDSPRPNEAWFVGYGQAIGASHYWVPIQIYSFDGYAFKELWATDVDRPPIEPKIQITKDAVIVTYLRDLSRTRVSGHDTPDRWRTCGLDDNAEAVECGWRALRRAVSGQ